MTAVLSVRGVSKAFGGLRALTDVTFEVGEGEILGIIGPNGAGKTTLINIITGITRPDEGAVLLRGEVMSTLPPHTIARRGIGRTFQIIKPFVGLSVIENVAVGARFGGARPAPTIAEALGRAEAALALVGLEAKRDAPIAKVTMSELRRLEIAKALAMSPAVILLDEVMAGLNHREVDDAVTLIRTIRNSGVAIVMVEHVMRAVMGVSERLVVLHQGRKITEGPPEVVVREPAVIEAYLGRKFAARAAEGVVAPL
jgi:ABC-type branched-subunit amino acid transport system ATPase component